jgi:DNA-binding NarL/FixJ family response regulator
MLQSVASEPHLRILTEAKGGQEVIELCRLQRPDLVLMDVGMPKVNGFEATQIIKAELPTTKVLMVSAHFDPFLVSEVQRAGADGYVTKLCTVQELVDATRGLLRGESHYPCSEKWAMPDTTGYCISRLFNSVRQQLVV